jgi:integrase
MASVPHLKRATRRAEVYARSEVEAILTAPRQPRDRVLLMTVHGCGLRLSEATQLKTSDIDRARMQLRVRDGKGAKGRVLPLSERLLKELVNSWRAQRQGKAGHDSPWLFLGKRAGQPFRFDTFKPHNVLLGVPRRAERAIASCNAAESLRLRPRSIRGLRASAASRKSDIAPANAAALEILGSRAIAASDRPPSR